MARIKRRLPQQKKFLFFKIVLYLILGTVLISGFWIVKKSIQKSIIYKLSRVNLVFQDSHNKIWVFSLEDREGKILFLPADQKVKVARGFGEYELGKVYLLGDLEKRGSQLLRETVQENLSAPIFGYLGDKKGVIKENKKGKAFLKEVFKQALLERLPTDLSKKDLFWLFWWSTRLSESLIKERVWGKEEADFFQDRRLREESFSIEILNATEHNGLAQQAGRFLEKAGGRVIRLADAPNQNDCQLLVQKKNLESYTAWWFKEVFRCSLKIIETDISRADLILILGENYWKMRVERW